MKKYWFKPKRYGYGVFPISWEGWLATLILLGVVFGLAYVNGLFKSQVEIENGFLFLLGILATMIIFTLLFKGKVKGGLQWKWGDSKHPIISKKGVAKFLRYFARSILILVAGFWFVFALLSGGEEMGGGIKGVLLNSPNALPWLPLFGLVYIAWKWEMIGGILIAMMGVFTIFAFNTIREGITFFLISLLLIVLGGCLLGSWWLEKK